MLCCGLVGLFLLLFSFFFVFGRVFLDFLILHFYHFYQIINISSSFFRHHTSLFLCFSLSKKKSL